MSKYSHYEMCEKIFGQRYKWNEQKQDYELYSRTDMWNKLIEQQDKIADLEVKFAESEKELERFKSMKNREQLAKENEALKDTIAVVLSQKRNWIKSCANLEEQLAEIEKERDANYENYSICWKDNEYLKKQLAEKEKEIAGVKNSCDYYMKRANDLVLKFAEKEEELKKFKSIGATPRQLRRAYQERYKYNERCCELEKQQIQNKINFAVKQLEKVKKFVIIQLFITTKGCSDLDKAEAKGCNELREETIKEIDNQIKQLKGDI